MAERLSKHTDQKELKMESRASFRRVDEASKLQKAFEIPVCNQESLKEGDDVVPSLFFRARHGMTLEQAFMYMARGA